MRGSIAKTHLPLSARPSLSVTRTRSRGSESNSPNSAGTSPVFSCSHSGPMRLVNDAHIQTAQHAQLGTPKLATAATVVTERTNGHWSYHVDRCDVRLEHDRCICRSVPGSRDALRGEPDVQLGCRGALYCKIVPAERNEPLGTRTHARIRARTYAADARSWRRESEYGLPWRLRGRKQSVGIPSDAELVRGRRDSITEFCKLAPVEGIEALGIRGPSLKSHLRPTCMPERDLVQRSLATVWHRSY